MTNMGQHQWLPKAFISLDLGVMELGVLKKMRQIFSHYSKLQHSKAPKLN